MLLVLVVAVLCGCGRIGFGDTPTSDLGDARSGDGANGAHDEDGDGIPDITDNCPHIANVDQDDVDGDTVGTLCDRLPGSPGQSLIYFSAMLPGDTTAFEPSTQTVQLADSLRVEVAGGEIDLVHLGNVDTSDIWIGFDVKAIGPLPHQISIEPTEQPNDPHTFGMTYENTTGSYVSITQFDGASYMDLDSQTLAAPLEVGPLVLRLRTSGFSMDATIEQQLSAMSSSALSFTPKTRFTLHIQHLAVELRYLAIVTSS